MTSTSHLPYPADYYYPEFADDRTTKLKLGPRRVTTAKLKPAINSQSAPPRIATAKHKSSTNRPKKHVTIDVATDHDLPDIIIAESAKVDPKKSLIRDPAEKNIPRLIVDENVIKHALRSTSNLNHIENTDSKRIPNGHMNGDLTKKTKTIESIKNQHQIIKVNEDEQPVDEHWKKEMYINDEGVVVIEPVNYDKNIYDGPFGLTRKGALIYYIGLVIFTLLAAVFLIMTGVLYGRSSSGSSGNAGNLAGVGICAFLVYLGIQLILIGIWHQKYRQENPVRKMNKKPIVHNQISAYQPPPMEKNEQYGYAYQQSMDYTPYGYYSNPPYVNEQMLLQQPVAGYYDSVVWPANIEMGTQPDAKFSHPMEWSLGPQQQSIIDTTIPSETDASNSTQNLVKRTKRESHKLIESQPSTTDFEDVQLNSTVIEQPLPVVTKASEIIESVQPIAPTQSTTEKSSSGGDLSPKKHHQTIPVAEKTDASSSVNPDQNHLHHRRHHHRHHSHHRHHYSHGHSPSSQDASDSHEIHRHRSVSIPRVATPPSPIITAPSLPKISTRIYHERRVKTGKKVKPVRDSSVTVNLEDIPNAVDKRLEETPAVHRTANVEPYSEQPSTQILVKSRVDKTSKIRSGKNTKVDGENETIVYPSTAVLTQKTLTKRKKKSAVVSNNIVEDLHLEDINDNDHDRSIKKEHSKRPTTKTIKNAFYN